MKLFVFFLISFFTFVMACGTDTDSGGGSTSEGYKTEILDDHNDRSEYKGNGYEYKKSSYNANSHNSGANCMDCHKAGGSANEYQFKVAGTVYDKNGQIYPGATVKLYTGQGGSGELKYILEVDRSGNFYTTERIDFGGGLYPAVEGKNGIKYMPGSISDGACNSCHDQSKRIWTE